MSGLARQLGLWTGQGEDLCNYETLLHNLTRKELQAEAKFHGLRSHKASDDLVEELLRKRQQTISTK
jgi:hypothetical protein